MDIDLEKLIAAGLFSAGIVHPYGHVAAASEEGRPASVDYKTGTEVYNDKGLSPEKQTNIHGAGFAAQDKMAEAMDSPEMRGFNAVYKALFPYIVDKMGSAIPGGDIGGMERASGNKYTRQIVQASALLNALLPRDSNIDVSFTTMEKGAPGLMFTVPINNNLMPIWSRGKENSNAIASTRTSSKPDSFDTNFANALSRISSFASDGRR